VLNAPTGLVVGHSNRTVSLHWDDNSSNEEGFYVVRALAGSTTFTRVGRLGANATSFTQTVPAGTYLYRVRAFNLTTGQLSAFSNQVHVGVK